VAALGHGGWQPEEWRQWGISRWHACDITLDNLQRHAGEVDAVVHCAGAPDVAFSAAHPFESLAKTVGTTADVLELLRARLPRARLVLVSSAAVYGDTSGRPIGERDALAPISVYGVHKQMAEELCACYARIHALHASVLRLFSIYGPGLRKQLLWDACNKLTSGMLSFAGTGAETRDWLHVSDAVALVAAVLQAEMQPYRVLNGGTGTGASVSQILEELSAALDVRARVVFTGDERSGNPRSLVADNAQARALGWRPAYEWRAGVREYARWFRSIS
jgi:UDP-glucose 4-epimerase